MVSIPDVRNGLLMGGRAVVDPRIQHFIDVWTHRVTKKAGATVAASPPGQEVIRLYATAAAREMADSISGMAESPVAKEQRSQARELLKSLDEETNAPDENDLEPGEVDDTLYSGPLVTDVDDLVPGRYGDWGASVSW